MGWYAVAGWQPLSDTGTVLASGTLTFTRTGTVTAKNIYSDKALSAALSNPLTLDANGRVTTNIFMLEDEGYRVVLKNSAGTTIWTREEQFGLALAVDEGTRRKEIIRSPFDHAAVGDGSTNDATALAAALAAADGILDLEGKTYRCDSSLTLRSGITIRNGTIDFSNASISAGLSGAGSAGSSTVVTSAAVGSQTITAAGHSGYTAGDLLRLRSSDTIATGHTFAELFRVEQTSGNDILVDGAILGTYSTSPLVEEITPVTDIRLENLTVVAPSSGYAIDLSLCERVRMSNVRVRCTAAVESIRVISCYDVLIDRCSVAQKATAEAGGIIIGDASRDVTISNCRIERALQAIEIGDDYASADGLCRDIKIVSCNLVWCGQLEIAEGARYVEIVGNTMLMDISPSDTALASILVGGADVTIRDNMIRESNGAMITVTPLVSSDYIIIANNNLQIGETTGIQITDTTLTVKKVVIDGNTIDETTGAPVLIAGTIIVEISVSRNTVRASTFAGVMIDINSADTLERAMVHGNAISTCTALTAGIRVAGTGSGGDSFVDVSHNTIDAEAVTSVTGIDASDASSFNNVNIADNFLVSCRTGIRATGRSAGAFVSIHDNTISNENSTSSIGISADTGSLSIRGNSIRLLTGRGILVDEALDIIVSGNYLVEADAGTATGIEIDNTTAGFSSCVISGNNLDVGGDGIEVDASTASTGLVIASNIVVITGTAQTIEITGVITGISIIGNYLSKSTDTNANVTIAGDAAGNITQCTLVGNHFNNGTYGIDISNNATSYHTGNTFNSLATGNTNGTFVANISS